MTDSNTFRWAGRVPWSSEDIREELGRRKLSGYVRQGDPEFTDADLEAELDLRDRITATAKAKPYLTPTEAQALVSSRSEDERKIEALVAMGVERGEAGDMIARELETAVDKVLQARMAKEANPDAAETTRRRNVGR